MTAPADRASTRTIVLRIVAVIAVVSIVVGVVLYTQLTKPRSREHYVKLGLQCLLRTDDVSRAELGAKLRGMAEALQHEPKWPRACADAFGRAGETGVQRAIERGELSAIEAALAPLAK